MGSMVDDRRAELVTALGLSTATGAALSIVDLERQYAANSVAAGTTPAVDGVWTDMVIVAPWTSGVGAAKCQYMKDSRGIVRCRGTLIGGAFAGGVPFWIIPAGFRPSPGSNYHRYVTGGGVPTDTVVVDGPSSGAYAGYDGAAGIQAAASNVNLAKLAWVATS